MQQHFLRKILKLTAQAKYLLRWARKGLIFSLSGPSWNSTDSRKSWANQLLCRWDSAHVFQHGFHSLCLTIALVRCYFWLNRVYKFMYLQCSPFSSELSSTFLPFAGSGLLFAFMCKCANLQSLSVIGRKGKCKRWINTDGGNSIFGPSSTSSEPSRSVAFILCYILPSHNTSTDEQRAFVKDFLPLFEVSATDSKWHYPRFPFREGISSLMVVIKIHINTKH